MGSEATAADPNGRYRRPMGYYKRKEKREESLNLRTTKSLKETLGRLSKAWEFLDSLEEGGPEFDPESKGNVSETAIRLLTVGAAASWKEIGGFEPQTPAQWEEFYRNARKAHEQEKRKKAH